MRHYNSLSHDTETETLLVMARAGREFSNWLAAGPPSDSIKSKVGETIADPAHLISRQLALSNHSIRHLVVGKSPTFSVGLLS